MRNDRTGHTGKCLTCGETVIVIRHPADAAMSAKELPTEKIRLFAIHLSDAGGDFVEAATTQGEFDKLVSSMICEKGEREQ